MKKQLFLCLSFILATAFTVASGATGTIAITSIQSNVEVGGIGTITLTYTSDVPCILNTQLRETVTTGTGVNWSPWHGQQDSVTLAAAATASTVVINYAISASEITSASLASSKPGAQFTFAFQLKTTGNTGFAYKDGTSANLVTLVPSTVVTNTVNITSVASTITAGSDLIINFNYTSVNAGIIKVEVRKFNGTNYVGGAAVIDTYIDPAAATTIAPVAISKTITIPAGTITSSALTGGDNYKVDITLYTPSYGYILDKQSPITITPNVTTIWNGTTWSNGTPSSSLEVIINGTYTTSGNLTTKKLMVNSGKSFTIASGNNVSVTNEVINNGTFVIENNANLIQTNNVSNTGTITVKRNSNLLKRLDYTMWSSPTGVTQKLNEFSPLTSTGRFYTYDSAANLYSIVSDNTPFSQGKGFLIRMPNTDPATNYDAGTGTLAFPGVFTGIPNNGDVSITGLTAGQYVAVGNPYPSTISAEAFIDANNATTGAGTLYFWRKTNGGATAYATYTKAGPVGTPVGSGSANAGFTPTADIAVGQGFITTVPNTNKIVFNNGMRINPSNSAQFLRTKAPAQKDRVWLNLSAGENPVNQILVAYMDGATTGVDNGIDGKYINDAATALTSNIDGGEYVIQGRPVFDASDVVALNFKTATAGTFTISKDHADGLFANGQDIYLVDATTGTETNLLTDGYTFTAAVGDSNGRFSLKYQKTLGVNTVAFDENSISIYKQNGVFNINAGNTTMKNVKVFDIQGRLILEQKEVNASTTTLKNLVAGKQAILIQITSDDNRVVTKKAIN